MNPKKCIYYQSGQCANKYECSKKERIGKVCRCKCNGVLDHDKIKAKRFIYGQY